MAGSAARRRSSPSSPAFPAWWRRVPGLVGQVLLTAGGVLGALALLLVALGPSLGLRPLVFTSGSMSPAIPAGSLAIARDTPAADLGVGDVVSVQVGETWVTHRVVGIAHQPGSALLQLRGDANDVPDDRLYRVSSAPRTVAHVAHAGTAVAWLSSPTGVLLLGLLVAHLAGWVHLPRRRPPSPRSPSGGGHRRRTAGRRAAPRRRLVLTRAGALAGGLLLPFVVLPAAHAVWADAVPVSGTRLGTVTPAPTTVSCGLLSVGSTTLTWSAVADATGYRLHYGAGGATTQDVGAGTLSKTFTGSTSGTFSVQAVFGSTSWLSATSNTKSYTSVVGLVGTCL